MGDLGGCGRHSVCVAGATPGKLCINLNAAISAITLDYGVGPFAPKPPRGIGD